MATRQRLSSITEQEPEIEGQGPVTISVTMSKTINLGNYNSAKVEIGIHQKGVEVADKDNIIAALTETVLNNLAAECISIEDHGKSWPSGN